MDTNIKRDFQICINVPLKHLSHFSEIQSKQKLGETTEFISMVNLTSTIGFIKSP